MRISRRSFFRRTSAITAGFAGLSSLLGCGGAGSGTVSSPQWNAEGYGELVPDPEGILDLPAGFRYTAFSRTGEEMDDGLLVPAAHDGMAAFAAPDGKTILVRNHEVSPDRPHQGAFGERYERLNRAAREKFYDYANQETPCLGGTTTVVYDTREQRLERHSLSLAGTIRNCADGPTPWGSWITCEENVQRREGAFERNHGYNFEVPASDGIRLAEPVPLEAMGRFNHEAIAVHAATGIVYQTEDRGDGLLYRFLPEEKGKPSAGGRLQALAIADLASADTRNWDKPVVNLREPLAVRWIDLEEIESPNDDLRQRGHGGGAAVFARGEGAWTDGDSIYFACTSGGAAKCGQVFRYHVSSAEGSAEEESSPGRLELFAESPNERLLNYCDNLTIAPWGDVILCEDGGGVDRLVGITPEGKYYTLGSNALNGSEFAGATFSLDGSTLFVNIQTPGITLAITGPWDRRAA